MRKVIYWKESHPEKSYSMTRVEHQKRVMHLKKLYNEYWYKIKRVMHLEKSHTKKNYAIGELQIRRSYTLKEIKYLD